MRLVPNDKRNARTRDYPNCRDYEEKSHPEREHVYNIIIGPKDTKLSVRKYQFYG